VRAEQLSDTYLDERSGERTHQALDIMAAQGTPVLAAADGKILRLFQSDLGGTTIYQQSADSAYVFYYAHLDKYAAGIADGTVVKRGDVIAYVGDTGNAGPGNYHLHFAIWRIIDPKRYWDGENINPYPILRGWNVLGERESATTGGRR
jgi:murein DD-endopeptidase MepM/ murein hydrolase activator NlpD